MFLNPMTAKPKKTCFVFDRRTGKVVHVHQFIPAHPDGDCADEEMERMALQLAPQDCDRSQLGVLHCAGDGDRQTEFDLMVKPKSGELIRKPVTELSVLRANKKE
ncbi:hypothetical protein DEA8626_01884 [Defluviimonas aquaemixtae]|uniref:Uncharacterized protein n=1 Tax=Albidovulum aquaemixtae TaxID=1542388 RepID=A0A2R8B6W2_9RHOB|nr:hypothetical protein [Defluviimonas aquaemixtae]SPH18347.1 hypothetical protein DEA8626_01884 [Defluviimonas aquaemixtae]